VSAYASVNGVDIYYEVHGRGRPLVLLHGALGTIESCFADLLPALAASSYRVIAVELHGHGHTPMLNDLSLFEIWPKTWHVSMPAGRRDGGLVWLQHGGGVALELAIRHPGVVRRLAYVGGACYQPSGLIPRCWKGRAHKRPASSTTLDGDRPTSGWRRRPGPGARLFQRSRRWTGRSPGGPLMS
jgi:pimeloyl-ACP methyl ester carboxylesterase